MLFPWLTVLGQKISATLLNYVGERKFERLTTIGNFPKNLIRYLHQLSALPVYQFYWYSGFSNWESNAGGLCHNLWGVMVYFFSFVYHSIDRFWVTQSQLHLSELEKLDVIFQNQQSHNRMFMYLEKIWSRSFSYLA